MKLVFVANEFELRAPVQQLLDRFLIGYPDAGRFKRATGTRVVLVIPEANKNVERRATDFGLVMQPNLKQALADADAALIFRAPAATAIAELPPRTRCFVHGKLDREAVETADRRSIQLLAGTGTRGAFYLPRIEVNRRLQKALVIVQGQYPTAEIDAIDALLPLIWTQIAGSSVTGVTPIKQADFWRSLKQDFWPLLKSAISRSDTPQGDPVLDGRTQDLVGLGLLEKLAQDPRGWLIEHADGFRWAIAVLNGVVNDYNVALQTTAGGILSTQIYRPPQPGEHHYSRLAASLERFFRGEDPPWPIEQSTLSVELFEKFDRTQRSMVLGGQRTAVI